MLIRVEVDREASLHLAVALGRHAQWCSRNGHALPDALADLARLADAAKNGQERTDPATNGEDSDPDAYARREFYSRKEVAAMSGKSERTIRRKIAAGQIIESPLGIPRAELNRLTEGARNA